MKKFQFKFAALEKIRKADEEKALRALGAAQRAFQVALEHKQLLLNSLENALLRRESLLGANLSGSDFVIETDFIQGTKQRVMYSDQAIVRSKRAVEKALRNYLEFKKKLKMVETLREKALAEFKRERNKYEQRQLDELYVMRAQIRKDASEWVKD